MEGDSEESFSMEKYKAAADVVNNVMKQVLEHVAPNKTIVELCTLGDTLIQEKVTTCFSKTKMEKGIAFPTCVSVNHICGHYSPLSDDKTVLNEGDVVKVDLGAHIDGFIVQSSHTIIATENPTECVTGKKADVICAAHFAAEAALRLFRPGNTNKQVTDAINEIAKAFNCNVLEGVLSHQLKRFVIDGNNVVISKESAEHKVSEVTFQEGDVFAFDIVMSTGEGKAKESESKATIYKRSLDRQYKPKMQASKITLNEISTKFFTMPFSLRNFTDEKKARLGMTELVKHDLVDSYPVLSEKDGEIVAQFKFTAILTAKETSKLTSQALPFVRSDLEITDPKIQAILSLGTKRNKKNKKKKKLSVAAEGETTTTTTTEQQEGEKPMDVEQ